MAKSTTLLDNILDKAVHKFLTWKLPDDFGPDAGISFKQPEIKHGGLMVQIF